MWIHKRGRLLNSSIYLARFEYFYCIVVLFPRQFWLCIHKSPWGGTLGCSIYHINNFPRKIDQIGIQSLLFINPGFECVLGLVGLLRVVASKVPQRLIGALCSSLPNFPTLALTHISSESFIQIHCVSCRVGNPWGIMLILESSPAYWEIPANWTAASIPYTHFTK